SVAHLNAFAANGRPRRFQRDFVEPPRLRIDGPIDTREFFLQHDVAGARLAKRQALVIGVLERLKGAHHLAMRHHGVERNPRLGLKFRTGVDIHLRSPCDSRTVILRLRAKRASKDDGRRPSRLAAHAARTSGRRVEAWLIYYS